MAYSAFGSTAKARLLIFGKWGSAEGRGGSLRLGTLGVNAGSCVVSQKCTLACFLVILGIGGFLEKVLEEIVLG